MEEHGKIEPHKITKPFQLLAAWLVGLVLVNGSFLTAAIMIKTPAWVSPLLVIASVVNVPLFLICIFILQTRFRPQMQEDTYYSKYLEATTAKFVSQKVDGSAISDLKFEIAGANKATISLIQGLGNNIRTLIENLSSISDKDVVRSDVLKKLENLKAQLAFSERNIERTKQQVDWQGVSIQVNDLLPEYGQILTKMKELGINISHTFGSSSMEPEVPKKKIIGFGSEVTIHHLRIIIKLLKPFGFNLIHYAYEPFNKGSIYVGSYIYQRPELPYKLCVIDSQFENAINNPNSAIEEIINRFLM